MCTHIDIHVETLKHRGIENVETGFRKCLNAQIKTVSVQKLYRFMCIFFYRYYERCIYTRRYMFICKERERERKKKTYIDRQAG